MVRVQPQRDPAVYRRRLVEKARQERQALRDAQRAEFERQRKEAIEAEGARRKEAMALAARKDHSAPVWAQIRQCYIEHRPAQIMHERKMRRCSGGDALPVYPGRRLSVCSEAIESKLVNAA